MAKKEKERERQDIIEQINGDIKLKPSSDDRKSDKNKRTPAELFRPQDPSLQVSRAPPSMPNWPEAQTIFLEPLDELTLRLPQNIFYDYSVKVKVNDTFEFDASLGFVSKGIKVQDNYLVISGVNNMDIAVVVCDFFDQMLHTTYRIHVKVIRQDIKIDETKKSHLGEHEN